MCLVAIEAISDEIGLSAPISAKNTIGVVGRDDCWFYLCNSVFSCYKPNISPERQLTGGYPWILSGDVRDRAPPRRGAYSIIRREQMGYTLGYILSARAFC
jgi:hypothetical protein